MKKDKESKRDKFVRLAEARTNKIIDMLQLLGNCSNTSTYSYTQSDVDKIFSTIESEVREVKKKFNKIILDPAVGISFELKRLLENLNILNDNKIKKKPVFFTTGELDKFKPTAEKFLGEEIEIYRIPK